MTDAASMTDTDAELALAQVAADLIETISLARAAEIAASGVLPKPARDWRELGPLARGAAEAANPPEYLRRPGPSAVVPLARSEKACGYCGNPDPGQLSEGPDQRYGFTDDWLCAPEHERACIARRERRWPPDPSKVPDAVLTALSQADEAHAARLTRPAPAAEEQPEPREPLPGWQESAYGALDTRGGWHPAANPFYAAEWVASPWGHTLRNPQHRSHLLGSDAFMRQAYGRAAGPGRDAAAAAHWGAESAREPSGGQQVPQGAQGGQPPPGGQGTPQTEVFGVPAGVHRGLEGGDIQLQQPEHPAALPARPGQQFQQPARGVQPRRRQPSRRKLRYAAGRRKPPQHPPGVKPPADSGWGASGEGPGGGSSET